MKRTIKIIIPDAGPINTLAHAGLLDLLMIPTQTRLVILESIKNEIISQSRELGMFIKKHEDRIDIIQTSICQEDEQKKLRGESLGKGRGDLAIADFLMHFIDDEIGNSPALVLFEDKQIARLHLIGDVAENAHFITTAAYLRKLEEEGYIDSFEETWKNIVDVNLIPNSKLSRSPNPQEREIESSMGSSIFEPR